MSTPRTKTVCRQVSSDAEWIWRATAEDVLAAAVAAGAGMPDSSSRLAGASAECHPVSGYDGKPLLVALRNRPSSGVTRTLPPLCAAARASLGGLGGVQIRMFGARSKADWVVRHLAVDHTASFQNCGAPGWI
jgi:hypothetical protein